MPGTGEREKSVLSMPHPVWWLSVLCLLQCHLKCCFVEDQPTSPTERKEIWLFPLHFYTSSWGCLPPLGVSVWHEPACPSSLLCTPRAQQRATASLRAKSGSYSLFLFSKHPSIMSLPCSPGKPRLSQRDIPLQPQVHSSH